MPSSTTLTDCRFVPDLVTLARDSDILVVAASDGTGSLHLVNAAVLAALGPDGFLVNVARGSVVDEDALVTTLQQGTLEGVGLDVFTHEPDVLQALRESPRMVMQPHRASPWERYGWPWVIWWWTTLSPILRAGPCSPPLPDTLAQHRRRST